MSSFRDYLSSVDPYALAYTGNDGMIDRTKVGYDSKNYSSFVNQGSKSNNLLNGLQNYISGLYGKYQSSQNTQANSQTSALQQQIAALQAQIAYQPKLPTFDVLGNYNRAQSQAEGAVNPLYTKYLNDYLSAEAQKKADQQALTAQGKVENATKLGETLDANAVTRDRTFQDARQALADIGTQEGQYQQDSGTQFDTDRRALAEKEAAAGLTGTGTGEGALNDQTIQRNITEGRQVQSFADQRAQKNQLATRSIGDLATSDINANTAKTQADTDADLSLEQYLNGLAADETNFRNDNEQKRLADVASQTQSYAQQGTQSFLASLAGSGWRPQDIALAYQVYG